MYTLKAHCVRCREDLRHLAICSVDPPGCKDIDDALHIRPLPNGHSELGVHIADVTAFLHPGTAMDDEAASRCALGSLIKRFVPRFPKSACFTRAPSKGCLQVRIFAASCPICKAPEGNEHMCGHWRVLGVHIADVHCFPAPWHC